MRLRSLDELIATWCLPECVTDFIEVVRTLNRVNDAMFVITSVIVTGNVVGNCHGIITHANAIIISETILENTILFCQRFLIKRWTNILIYQRSNRRRPYHKWRPRPDKRKWTSYLVPSLSQPLSLSYSWECLSKSKNTTLDKL